MSVATLREMQAAAAKAVGVTELGGLYKSEAERRSRSIGPALLQAAIGIAVSTATDVAKSTAGIVLTKAGMKGAVAAVDPFTGLSIVK